MKPSSFLKLCLTLTFTLAGCNAQPTKSMLQQVTEVDLTRFDTDELFDLSLKQVQSTLPKAYFTGTNLRTTCTQLPQIEIIAFTFAQSKDGIWGQAKEAIVMFDIHDGTMTWSEFDPLHRNHVALNDTQYGGSVYLRQTLEYLKLALVSKGLGNCQLVEITQRENDAWHVLYGPCPEGGKSGCEFIIEREQILGE